jgi:hypothetical protein
MMYDSYIVKRTQIYLEERQATELARRSDAQGVTASHLIREAIERYLASPDDETTELARQQTALREAFGSLPKLPDGSAFVEEIRRGERARDERLRRQWRSR